MLGYRRSVRAPLPPLIELEAFEAAARHGSFAAAATELHLTASAVSHRIRSLERHLGVPLFTRHARRIELTDHGHAYAPTVRRAFDELAVASTGMFGWGRPAGRLTVRAPISYAVTCIAPRLHQFTDAHPGVEVRLVSAIWADSVAGDDVDVDIRYGTGTWPGHRSELLHHETVTAVWSPAFATRHGRIIDPARLADLPRVQVLGQDHPWADLMGDGPVVTVDTSLAALAMVDTGGWSTVVLTRFAEPGLRAGRLVSSPDATAAVAQQHSVVTPDDRTDVRTEALLFVDWLRANATTAAPPEGGTAVVERQR